MKAIRYFIFALALAGLWGLFYTSATLPDAQADIVKRTRLIVNATGDAGSASGEATTNEIIQGRIVRVDIDYATGISTTTDLTLSENDDLIATNIVNRADTATDAQVFPTISLTDNTGTAVTYNGTQPIKDYLPVVGKMTASLAQTTAATPAATIDIYWREDK